LSDIFRSDEEIEWASTRPLDECPYPLFHDFNIGTEERDEPEKVVFLGFMKLFFARATVTIFRLHTRPR
jgi:hypothetical protein